MTNMRAILALTLGCFACDGIGAPIVGDIPVSDGGVDSRCSITPACREIRSVEPERFEIPEERRRLQPNDDCDGDGFLDAYDVCPAVPNGAQLEADCANARAACDRLRSGETDMALADLRGCDAQIEAPEAMSLVHANLSCASISISYPDGEAHAIDLSEAIVAGSSLEIDAAGAVAITADGTTFQRSFLHLRGGARLRADRSVFDDVVLVAEPGGILGSTSPGIELIESDLGFVSLLEEEGNAPGRVRFDRSTIASSTISAQVLEINDGSMLNSFIDAAELFVLGVEMTGVAFRVGYGAFAAVDMTDAIFAQCSSMQFSASRLWDVDIPACEPEELRFDDTELRGANLGGGASMVGSDFAASIIGAGPSSALLSAGSTFDAVRICDLGAAAFIGGELRCVHCDADDFMDGNAVCVSGAELVERGCQSIEFATPCESVSRE
jgi:uncharacterized protein YjbI with pentapeptide repeats